MIKLLLIISAFITTSCTTPYDKELQKKTKPTTLTVKKFQRVESNLAREIRPSESMSVGVTNDKNKIHNDFNENDEGLISADLDDLDQENNLYDGHFKVGNPYEVLGVSYVPQNYDDYEEIGVASWYGDDFHGKLTANGETCDMESLTAAHPTLPLPSIVKVTNLGNNKTVVVRVNDRGPFAKNRVIDLSQRAATILDFKDSGTTEVKIELLRSETDELLHKLKIKN